MMKVFIFTTNKSNALHLINILKKRAEYVITADMTLLDDTYDLVIIPGGNAKNYLKKMGDEGIDILRQYINNGGGYLGLCAGAYLGAMNDVTLQKNIGIGLLPVYYTLFKKNVDIKCIINLNDFIQQQDYICGYHNGAVFEVLSVGDAVPVAQITGVDSNKNIQDFLLLKIAIVMGTYGNGQVVLCGPHIEAKQPDYTFRFIEMIARKK